jgi:catechol 2,3-dioxygenase-like lactoylglutathione lyase family enzyme
MFHVIGEDRGTAPGFSLPGIERRYSRRMRLHHVQVAIPPGGEDEARAFYRDLLGMKEIPKPEALAVRGGCWFRLDTAEIHCGIEQGFRPARKAHPALEVEAFDVLMARLIDTGLEIRSDDLFPGLRRFYVNDPFGNRVEVLEAVGQ